MHCVSSKTFHLSKRKIGKIIVKREKERERRKREEKEKKKRKEKRKVNLDSVIGENMVIKTIMMKNFFDLKRNVFFHFFLFFFSNFLHFKEKKKVQPQDQKNKV